MSRFISALVVPVLALSACAIVPKPIAGDFPVSAPKEAGSTLQAGSAVRWGGTIVSVEPRPNETCFEILAKDLSDAARPLKRDASIGRFVACKPGFFDPEVFVKGRELTVTGRFERIETRKIGEYDYPFPMITAEVVYLWPERLRENDRLLYASPFFGPSWWNLHQPFYYRPRHYGGNHPLPPSAPPPQQ